MNFWTGKKILITGGAGFLGTHLVEELASRGVSSSQLRIPRSRDTDLRKWEDCVRSVKGQDLVIHLAARVEGIGFNRNNPATLFYDNATPVSTVASTVVSIALSPLRIFSLPGFSRYAAGDSTRRTEAHREGAPAWRPSAVLVMHRLYRGGALCEW